MNHRKKALCLGCHTLIEYFGFPHNRWVHVELELAHTAGHSPQPSTERPDWYPEDGEFETQGATA